MATDQAAAESKGKAKKGLSRSTLLIVVLLVVIVAGGIYFFLGRGDSTSDGAAEKEEVHLGVVVTLEPIFINLKDDRFLKLGMALQTTHEGGGGGHGGGGGPDVDGAMALDAAIEVFSDQDMQMLSTINGRSELKEELVSRIVEGYGPEITTIYFTEFVMQ